MTAVKDKLIQKIGENIGEHFVADIADAFAAGGEIEDKLKSMIENEHVELVDQGGDKILQRHMSLIAEAKEEDEPKARPVSPNPRELAGAELQMQESKF